MGRSPNKNQPALSSTVGRDVRRTSLPGRAFLAVFLAVLAAAGASSGSGCIGVSEKHVTPGIVGGTTADLRVCRAGTRPAADGIIDDFEDDNTQVTIEGGRDGYWWTKRDEKGSTVGPHPFAPSDGGADGSEKSMRAVGTTVNVPDAWGAGFGVNFVNQGVFYDASKYAGITFKAKTGPGSTALVRFKVGDVNTHPAAQLCKSCWNHFGANLTLTSQWKTYKVMFTDLRQEPSWGDPRPAAVTPTKLVAIDWSIGTGQAFDLWIDDVGFVECQ